MNLEGDATIYSLPEQLYTHCLKMSSSVVAMSCQATEGLQGNTGNKGVTICKTQSVRIRGALS